MILEHTTGLPAPAATIVEEDVFETAVEVLDDMKVGLIKETVVDWASADVEGTKATPPEQSSHVSGLYIISLPAEPLTGTHI